MHARARHQQWRHLTGVLAVPDRRVVPMVPNNHQQILRPHLLQQRGEKIIHVLQDLSPALRVLLVSGEVALLDVGHDQSALHLLQGGQGLVEHGYG